MDICNKCGFEGETLAVEINGKIKKWICEECFFKNKSRMEKIQTQWKGRRLKSPDMV